MVSENKTWLLLMVYMCAFHISFIYLSQVDISVKFAIAKALCIAFPFIIRLTSIDTTCMPHIAPNIRPKHRPQTNTTRSQLHDLHLLTEPNCFSFATRIYSILDFIGPLQFFILLHQLTISPQAPECINRFSCSVPSHGHSPFSSN
jgi:hypothetical protein